MTIRCLCVYLFCFGTFSVAGQPKYPTPPADFFQSNLAGKGMTIATGDVLNIRFYYSPELNKTVKVREDGKISLDLFQGIDVAGKTPEELRKQLVDLYSQEFTNPEVTVDLENRANSSVYVTGEVSSPGAKELHGRTTVAMALAMSQVNQKVAGTKSVFLIRATEDGNYRVYQLDASFPDGRDSPIVLAPGDILFVPRKRIVKADDFIEQWVRNLLPVTTNASIFYSFGTYGLASAAATH